MAKKTVQDRIADIEGGIFPQNAEAAPSNGGGSVIVEDTTEPHPDIERITKLINENVEELQRKEAEFQAYVDEMSAVVNQKKNELDESAAEIRLRIVELNGIQKYLNNDI